VKFDSFAPRSFDSQVFPTCFSFGAAMRQSPERTPSRLGVVEKMLHSKFIITQPLAGGSIF
jgi:hypothetical protein